ncbi:unnamed protein product, partial [Orchesella dallaii]
TCSVSSCSFCPQRESLPHPHYTTTRRVPEQNSKPQIESHALEMNQDMIISTQQNGTGDQG